MDMDHSHHDHMSTNTTPIENATSLATTVASVLSTMAQSTPHHGPASHSDAHSTDDPTMDMGMQMWFYVSKKATVLFEEWNVDSVGGMVGSVIGIIFLSILYEGLKFFREHLHHRYYSKLSYSTCAVTGGNGCGDGAELHRVSKNRLLSLPHIIQTGLHIVQIVLSYFLMLIFMTYNVWLCLAVVIGSGIGYFFFGWKKSTVVDISDHCH